MGDYFGRRSYGTLSGIMRASDVVGSIMIPLYAGWVFDRTESYTAALVTLVAMLGAAALLISMVRRPSRASQAAGLSEKPAA